MTSKKRMPVNVLEDQSAGGAKQPILDHLVGSGSTGSAAGGLMTESAREKVEAHRLRRTGEALRSWVLGSLLVGLVPSWFLAFVVLVAVQFTMIRSLGRRYGGDAAWELGRPFLGAVLGAGIALHLASYLACWLPLLGDYSVPLWKGLGAAAGSYVVGRVFVKHFEAGCTLLSLDVEAMKEFFRGRYGSTE